MAPRVVRLVLRLVYVAIAGLGLSMAAGGYPPSGDGLPVTLIVGVLLALAGIGGAIWPEKIRSGSSTVG